jgi:hypothetical protein
LGKLLIFFILLQKMDKIPYFEMDLNDFTRLVSDTNSVTKLTFKAWIPDYNPLIKVFLKRYNSHLALAYLRVSSVGQAFFTVCQNVSSYL